jgi:hypothetical protein
MQSKNIDILNRFLHMKKTNRAITYDAENCSRHEKCVEHTHNCCNFNLHVRCQFVAQDEIDSRGHYGQSKSNIFIDFQNEHKTSCKIKKAL